MNLLRGTAPETPLLAGVVVVVDVMIAVVDVILDLSIVGRL